MLVGLSPPVLPPMIQTDNDQMPLVTFRATERTIFPPAESPKNTIFSAVVPSNCRLFKAQAYTNKHSSKALGKGPSGACVYSMEMMGTSKSRAKCLKYICGSQQERHQKLGELHKTLGSGKCRIY